MPDLIETMALAHCARWNWRWDQMTESRRELARSEMRAIVEGLAAAGLAIVPLEPTREMWAAGADAACRTFGTHHDNVTGAVWPAMVAARQSR